MKNQLFKVNGLLNLCVPFLTDDQATFNSIQSSENLNLRAEVEGYVFNGQAPVAQLGVLSIQQLELEFKEDDWIGNWCGQIDMIAQASMNVQAETAGEALEVLQNSFSDDFTLFTLFLETDDSYIESTNLENNVLIKWDAVELSNSKFENYFDINAIESHAVVKGV